MHNGEISYWMRTSKLSTTPQSGQLPCGRYDLAIIGGGFSGLWLAYYAQKARPTARIGIFERNEIGYGASGRNGGWVSCNVPGNRSIWERQHGIDAVRLMQRHMASTRSELVAVCSENNIDCDLYKGGRLEIAENPAQVKRLLDAYKDDIRYGLSVDEVIRLDAANVRKDYLNIQTVQSGLYYKNDLRVQPAKLARGLKNVLVTHNVHIYEGTTVSSYKTGSLSINGEQINADTIVCCTEGYSGKSFHNKLVIPIYSSIIASRPLGAEFWQQYGWRQQFLLGNAAHLFIYAQRTADDRIVIGGRGAPYGFGGAEPGDGELDGGTISTLKGNLQRFFPGEIIDVDHAWRGCMGVTRDWCTHVGFDRQTRLGEVFGFAGHGVAATNLAARTIVDRIYGTDSDLLRLPWNDHVSPPWEPEPIRWLGVHGMYRAFGFSDWYEDRTQREKTFFVAAIGKRFAKIY